MRIGIDFDNTIADYSGVFPRVAVELGLLDREFSGTKTEVRDALRGRPGGEEAWQRLQGQIYGRFLPLARPMPGVMDFLGACREHGAKVYVISHKSEHGHFDEARINLREAAMSWMSENGLFDAARSPLSAKHVMFAPTRTQKIVRIGKANVAHFVDDLAEVLADPGFPATTAGYLLGPDGYRHWDDVREAIFGA